MTAYPGCSRAVPVFPRVAAREDVIVVRLFGESVYRFSVNNSRAPVYPSCEWASGPIKEKKKELRGPYTGTRDKE